MAKFKVGDEVAIAALVKITAIQPTVTGKVSYSTDRGFCIHETLMDEIALAQKEPKTEEPKPALQPAHRFKVGDRVANANPELGLGTINEIGRTLGIETYFIEADDGQHWICTSDAISPAPEPQPAHRFKVGDRVQEVKAGYGIGEVIEVDTDNKTIPYRVKFDGGNVVWLNENRISPAPEPPKFYTGKVVCYGCEAGTEWVYGALIGKIGTIQNGHATWRSGLGCEGYTSFDDFCARNKYGRWLEIKE